MDIHVIHIWYLLQMNRIIRIEDNFIFQYQTLRIREKNIFLFNSIRFTKIEENEIILTFIVSLFLSGDLKMKRILLGIQNDGGLLMSLEYVQNRKCSNNSGYFSLQLVQVTKSIIMTLDNLEHQLKTFRILSSI